MNATASDARTRRAVLRGTGSLLALATAGCVGGSSGTGSNAQSVAMTENLRFDPKTVQIPVGTTVIWENTSLVGHTVTAYGDKIPKDAAYFASGGFESERTARQHVDDGLISPDERYEHTFEQAGRYGYFCIPHEQSGMVGTIHVQQ
jgi:plastocyanin